MSEHAEAAEFDGADREAATELRAAIDAYATYLGRMLDPLEVRQAQTHVQAIWTSANVMQQEWAEQLQDAPSGAQVRLTMMQAEHPGHDHVWRRVAQNVRHPAMALERRTSLAPVRDVVQSLQRTTSAGFDFMALLGPAVAALSHYERQVYYSLVSAPDDEEAEADRKWAANLKHSMDELARGVRNDVESQRSQVEILNLYLQTNLADGVSRLTAVLVMLTVLIVGLSVLTIVVALLER